MDTKLKQLQENLTVAEDELRKHKAIPPHERGKTYSWWYSRCLNKVRVAEKAITAYRLQAAKIPGILKRQGFLFVKPIQRPSKSGMITPMGSGATPRWMGRFGSIPSPKATNHWEPTRTFQTFKFG